VQFVFQKPRRSADYLRRRLEIALKRTLLTGFDIERRDFQDHVSSERLLGRAEQPILFCY